jgi:hypothetical protein
LADVVIEVVNFTPQMEPSMSIWLTVTVTFTLSS